MTIIKEVYLHPKFEYGVSDKDFLTDLPFMTPDEKVRLALWVSGIVQGLSHEGMNKPSWLNNGQMIPAAQDYKKNNVWHYHCGPYGNASETDKITENTFDENTYGRRSSQIFHYTKQKDIIIVLGYSRKHIPFPAGNSRSNPLRNRGHAWHLALPRSK